MSTPWGAFVYCLWVPFSPGNGRRPFASSNVDILLSSSPFQHHGRHRHPLIFITTTTTTYYYCNTRKQSSTLSPHGLSVFTSPVWCSPIWWSPSPASLMPSPLSYLAIHTAPLPVFFLKFNLIFYFVQIWGDSSSDVVCRFFCLFAWLNLARIWLYIYVCVRGCLTPFFFFFACSCFCIVVELGFVWQIWLWLEFGSWWCWWLWFWLWFS